ncbi:S-layer homology domain-containing protein [Neofamilia massiliensis]|uniref:S-layer homology domain-containing protein n=1 Tax=Neofamilia massiliensis TaxID=1673724 RepID=UPI0006BB694F|nr:S-layer homology domain-containing protein [Neofamilia massiliensis]
MQRKKLPLIFLLLLALITIKPIKTYAFTDTDKHWSAEYVDFLAEKKLLTGYKDGSFKPDDNITRAEFYKIINSLVGYNKSYAVSFSDVKKSDWYYDEVARGIKAGYIIPTTGNLHPNRPITRQEVVKILGQVYKLDELPDKAKDFLDKGEIKEDTLGYVGALVDLKIIEGYQDGNFYPKKEITRGEVCKILYLSMDKLKETKATYLVDSEIKFGPRGLYE